MCRETDPTYILGRYGKATRQYESSSIHIAVLQPGESDCISTAVRKLTDEPVNSPEGAG